MMSHQSLIQKIADAEHFRHSPGSTHTLVLEALEKVDRRAFLPTTVSYKGHPVTDFAYEDQPLPIGYAQTCSQPSVVATMLQLLDLQQGMHVLEIGSGCGYAAAVLAYLVGRRGKVTTLERQASLAELAQRNIKTNLNEVSEKVGLVKVIHADGSGGYAPHSPYHRIMFSAGIPGNFDFTSITSQVSALKGRILSSTYSDVPFVGSPFELRTFYGSVKFVPLESGLE